MFKFRDRCQVIISEPVSLMSVTTVVLSIPEGKRFVVDEVGLIATTVTGAIVLQPTISFGSSGSPAAIIAASLTTLLTLPDKRERYSALLVNDVMSSLSASVTIAATGPSAYAGRFYFRGFLL